MEYGLSIEEEDDLDKPRNEWMELMEDGRQKTAQDNMGEGQP